MKTLFATCALLAVGASFASAQEWRRDRFPYEERHHAFCQEQSRELWRLERLDAEHRSSHQQREREIGIRYELDNRCRGFRWHGY